MTQLRINSKLNVITVLFLFICSPFAMAETEMNEMNEINEIHIATEAWEDSTNKDGTGLYWEIFREVFEPQGIKVTMAYVPYSRSVRMTQTKKVDAFLGAYMNEVDQVIFPKWHFDVDEVVAVASKERAWQWQGENTLKDMIVGYIRDYEIDTRLTVPVKAQENSSRSALLSMVILGRIDFYLDDRGDVVNALEEFGEKSVEFDTFPVKNIPIYIVFADTERGKALSTVYDKRIKILIDNGWLRQRFEKWNWSAYPY